MRILLLNSLDICITNPYNMRNYLTNLKQGVAGVARTPKVEADDDSSDPLTSSRGDLMANPQKENGFTPIANELLEALAGTVLTAYEYKALLLILRNTYGYKRKEWTIKKWKEFEKIGIGTSHIKRTITMLCGRGIISVSGKTIGFNKDYEEWKDIDKNDYFINKKVTSRGNKKVTSSGKSKLPHEVIEVTSSGNSAPSKPRPRLALPDPKENLKKDLKKVLKENAPNNVLNLVHNSSESSVGTELNSVLVKPKPKQRKDIHGFPSYDEFFTWLEGQPREKRHIFQKTMVASEIKLYEEWRSNNGNN